jgi:predicted dehydrogenase
VHSEIGAGIAGVGFMGAAPARAVRRVGARLVGVTSSTLERGREAPADLNALRAFLRPDVLTSYEQIDVVHIGNPNLLPLPLLQSPFAPGKRVIVEKLLAVETGSGDQLLSAHASVPYVDRVAHAQAKDIQLFPETVEAGPAIAYRALRPLIIQEPPTTQRGIR